MTPTFAVLFLSDPACQTTPEVDQANELGGAVLILKNL